MANIIDILKERGFIEAISSEDLRNIAEKPLKVYCGFDPTSDSLHLGHLIPLMGLAWWQRLGHTPIALVGGATGMIGDPSGRSSERNLLNEETLTLNMKGIQKNLSKILVPSDSMASPILVNNYDWFKGMSTLSFLRDVGRYFRIGPMLGKESVRNRMQTEEGMSFTEFSYQLLQGYDFYHLFCDQGVTVQMGGSDQWGNILAGIDLTRKICKKTVYGLTFPLLTRSDGQKFGKSEKGAIWLSDEKISAYEFYQYLFRVSDLDVIKLMRLLTFMDMEEIRKYEAMMQREGYLPNTAQKRLAEEVTRTVFSEKGLMAALKVTDATLPGSDALLDSSILENLSGDMPSFDFTLNEVIGMPVIELMVKTGLQESKSAARKLVRNGGGYLNNTKIENEEVLLTDDLLIDGYLLMLSAGKKNKVLIRLLGPVIN